MPSAGDGMGGHKDPALIGPIKWVSERERFAAIASGLRVMKTTRGVQVQVLEFGPGGVVRVASVVPGDVRHAALYRTLIKPESEWGNGGN